MAKLPEWKSLRPIRHETLVAPCSPAELRPVEEAALKLVRDAVAKAGKRGGLVAYSGGKDSLVAAHLAARCGVTRGVCETSFVFARMVEDVKRNAERVGLKQVAYVERHNIAWLRRHREIIFTDDGALRSWTMGVRQQASVRRYAKLIDAGVVIFGRRTAENTVPSALYRSYGRLQCHPLRDWTTAQVWAYIYKHKLPVPWIYSTSFGRDHGCAPFYLLRKSEVGSVARAWQIVEAYDPAFTKKNLLGE